MAAALGPVRYKILLVMHRKSGESFIAWLSQSGYQVFVTSTGGSPLDAVKNTEPDLILLDLDTRDMDGFAFCRAIRNSPSTRRNPILALSSSDRAEDVHNALESGADDCIKKSIERVEFVARVRALLRRYYEHWESVLKAGGITMEVEKHNVRVGKRLVSLSPYEFALLHLLMRKVDRVLSPAYLMEYIWGFPPRTSSKSLAMCFSRLRKKLGDAGRLIETTPHFGYCLRKNLP